MDTQQRRAILESKTNPDSNLDYIVQLSGRTLNSKTTVELRYVPDRLVLKAASFASYLEALGNMEFPGPEDLAVTALTDINDELVARWIQVVVTTPDTVHESLDTHMVVLEDRQPRWDNAGLLARLKPF